MIVFLFMFQYLSLPYIRNIDYISLGKPFFGFGNHDNSKISQKYRKVIKNIKFNVSFIYMRLLSIVLPIQGVNRGMIYQAFADRNVSL